ncbi:hypothetical protein Pa4123_24500 [Phytohabitans aurantiacus]|uniref:Uncharacterized protein n=1 Tax=Phytohabitans aurantiacus TaxID=3016789 RepID=A0ABQ5QSB6_9ACTN|nr:hypothetical protein Pa4123_24500 [Phytohabitans aurantiacus]
MSPADATTFQTFATISARISSAILRPSLENGVCLRTYPIMARPLGSSRSTVRHWEGIMAKKSRKKKARKKSAANHGKRPNS